MDLTPLRVSPVIERHPGRSSHIAHLKHLLALDHGLEVAVRVAINDQRRMRLAIGDSLLHLVPMGKAGVNTSALEELKAVAESIGLSFLAARTYRYVASHYGTEARERIDALDIEVSFTTILAAVKVPSVRPEDREAARQQRIEHLQELAEAAAGTDNPSVTEAAFRLSIGDPQSAKTQTATPLQPPSGEATWDASPEPELAPTAAALRVAIDTSSEAAHAASQALLENPVRRAEVVARLVSEPGWISELVADEPTRRAIQKQIRAAAQESDPDDKAMDEAAEERRSSAAMRMLPACWATSRKK